MAQYQGHRSWNAWNVSLWIANDEKLYRLALECRRFNGSLKTAARAFVGQVRQMGMFSTPDGAEFNETCVREALKGLE